jgi:glycosyltransferase involved in cell wall biosynthesis
MRARVLALVARYEPVRTGGERYNWEVIEGLRQRNVEVVIRDENDLPRWLKHGLQAWVGFFYIIYKEKKCTHVFAVHGLHRRLVPALWFARLILRKKIIVLVHHLSSPLKPSPSALQERIFEKWFSNNADIVVTVSKYTADSVASLPVSRSKILTIYPAVDPPEDLKTPKGTSRKMNILTLGNMEPRKGYDIVIESLAGLGNDFAFIIAGDDTANPGYVEKLRRLSTSLGISDKIRLAGRVSNDERERLFADADIYIQSSFLEGFGISALEAAARGVPVITTRVGAIPEIFVDGETALFVDAGDVEGLRKAIGRLLTDDELRKRLAANGLKIPFTKRTWREVADEFYSKAFLRLT